MNAITIYYYTAWNGYSWQGCDDATAADLQRYMEAAGVLPGDAGREPPLGGAIACQIGDCMGVAVYRCGIRSRGDAFGRDSLFISLAFVPLEYGPVDFSAIMSLSQMSPSVKGELVPVSVPMSGIAASSVARRDGAWRDESFTMRFSGISGLRDASSFFFLKSCQLGLLRATFESSTGSVAGVSVSLSYHVFPEVAALAEASRAYSDARKLSRGSISDEHPVSMKLWDAVNQLQTRRIDKMPGYTGLAEYLSERDAELGGVIARVSKYVRRTTERQASVNVAAAASSCGAPNPKRSAKTRDGRQSWLSYLFATIGIMLVVGFAALTIISRFSELKEKRAGDVRRLEEKIKELEDERDRAKERGERDLDNARGQWKEEIQKRDDRISMLEKSYNSAVSSNRELRVELAKESAMLAEAKKCRERFVAATNEICNIGKKRVDDVLDTVKALSEVAKQFPDAEIAKAGGARARILDDYKGRDKVIVDVDKQDEYIAQLKLVEKGLIKAFDEAYKRVRTRESDFRYLNNINNELKAQVKDLEARVHSKSTRVGGEETPARYVYDVKYEKLEDKDWRPHHVLLANNCGECWRCRKSEQIRQGADGESRKLESDANELKNVLNVLRQTRKDAEEKGAAVYARADYEAARSKYERVHANDIDTYKKLLNDAKESFRRAGELADEAKSKGKKAPREDAPAEKPKGMKPQK